MRLNYYLLGKRIQNTRKKKGITQMMLAERIDRSAAYISYVETGSKHCSLETLILIANALNVSTDELLFDSLENTVKVSNHKFAAIIADCSEYELQILLDVIINIKLSLREHKKLKR